VETLDALFGSNAETITWWQMCVRALVVACYAIVLFRVASRRIAGRDAVLDIVFAVIIGSTLSRALTGNAPLLPSMVAMAVVVLLHAVLAAGAAKFRWISRLTTGSATKIAADGKVDWRRARRANLGEEDVQEELRLHGVPSIESVKEAYLERNGRISIIRRGE
jgi:uncharacterized membrane protein YcaP (DUF421 family)